jgi:tRNA threonylcarbamoyladenosine biosynthesis protein TsaB
VTPLVLAADTTHEYGSLALARGPQILEELPLRSPSGFAHVIYGELDGLLRRHNIGVRHIDCFAAASGPGSFTGVRVGLAFIKGLAEALGKPALAISNLRALACFGTAPLRGTVIDARRGEVYGAVYDASGAIVQPEGVSPLDRWLAGVPPGVEIVSNDFTFAGTALDSFPKTIAPCELAAAIAQIAASQFERGEARDPAALDANYVRRSDAELFWKEA